MANRLAEDERNDEVEMSVRYDYYVNPSTLSVSIGDCSNTAPVDILRVFLQTAEELQSRDYNAIKLKKGFAHRFTMDGAYFQKLGEEYNFQNPVYTTRTLPEKLKTPNGEVAYRNYGSGLGALSAEMETFKNFILDWCE